MKNCFRIISFCFLVKPKKEKKLKIKSIKKIKPTPKIKKPTRQGKKINLISF